MNFFSMIDLDILVLIFLITTVYLAAVNNSRSNYKNKIYIFVAINVIMLLMIEIASVIIIEKQYSNLATFNKIINIMSFIIAPLNAYLIVLHEEPEYSKKKSLIIPLVINFIICSLNYKYNIIFSLNENNVYKREIAYMIPATIALFYCVLFFKVVHSKIKKYRRKDLKILYFIMIIPIVGMIIQISYSDYLVLWSSTGMALIIFYVYNKDYEFKYDNLTGASNRYALEVYAANKLFKNKKITLIYIDVNDFKNINDTYGHKEGDLVLKRLVKVLYDSIDPDDIVVRIGGDEFIIITKVCEEEEVRDFVKQIKRNISLSVELNFKEYVVSISCGYETFDLTKERCRNIDALINKVDKLMYVEKKLKNSNKFK